MSTSLRWEEFAEAAMRQLVRPREGEPLLIIADTSNHMELTEALLAAGLRSGADCQLMVKNRFRQGTESRPGPVLSAAIRASRLMLSLCGGIVRAPATIEARAAGARLLSTELDGIEDYAIRALLDVDQGAMIRNGERVMRLWDEATTCRVTSPQGTDVSFQLRPRRSIVGDGALSEDGEVDFFPGVQVSIAPVEETINGTIVVDASDSVQRVVGTPYVFQLRDGRVVNVEGGREANAVRNWMQTRNDPTIYRLSHFSIGLNPQAGISGTMIEDERMLTAVDFGFGYQDPKFNGTIPLSPYHLDVMLATPTILLDHTEMSGGGKLNPELGFEDM
jgi:leucyl aminopeptidase (aminopeptidase T)